MLGFPWQRMEHLCSKNGALWQRGRLPVIQSAYQDESPTSFSVLLQLYLYFYLVMQISYEKKLIKQGLKSLRDNKRADTVAAIALNNILKRAQCDAKIQNIKIRPPSVQHPGEYKDGNI